MKVSAHVLRWMTKWKVRGGLATREWWRDLITFRFKNSKFPYCLPPFSSLSHKRYFCGKGLFFLFATHLNPTASDDDTTLLHQWNLGIVFLCRFPAASHNFPSKHWFVSSKGQWSDLRSIAKPISRCRCGYIFVTNTLFFFQRTDCSVLPVLVKWWTPWEFKVILLLRGTVGETLARLALVRGSVFLGLEIFYVPIFLWGVLLI